MKRLSLAVLMGLMLAAGACAFGQESDLLAKCLGGPLAAYGKAFGETYTEVKKTPQGKVTVGDYKTGSARIEVIQKAGAKKPDVVYCFFYQEPKRDWKLALKDLGLSTAGVVAKEDAKHHVHLSHIKAAKAPRIEAVYIPMDGEHGNGPELHMTLR